MKNWEIYKKAENSRSIYWGCGSDVTVLEVQSTQGPRFVCMTCRTMGCEHGKAVERARTERASEAA